MNTRHIIGFSLLIVGALCITHGISLLKKQTQVKSFSETIIIGTNAEYQPFTFIDSKGNLVGFEIDVAREIATRLGNKVDMRDMSFDALIPEIQLGTIHMIAAGMTPTQERAERVLFTTPHLQGEPLMLMMRVRDNFGSDYASLLKTKRIAVNQGYTSESYAEKYGCPLIIRLSGSSVSDGLLALQSNQADCYISTASVLKPFFDQDTKNEYHVISLPDTEQSTALAVSKKYPDLYQQIEQVITTMLNDGTIDTLKKKWKLS